MNIQPTIQSCIIAAITPKDLLTRGQQILAELESKTGESAFQTLLETSEEPIPTEFARMGWVCESLEEAKELLQVGLNTLAKKEAEGAWSLRKGLYFRSKSMEDCNQVVALFSGQGSQYLGMCQELLQFPEMATTFDAMDALFQQEGGLPLSAIIFPPPPEDEAEKKAQEHRLMLTEHAQPAIGIVSMGLYKILKAAGLQVKATIGHSFGELTALWGAGVLEDQDYLFLAKARGQAMRAPNDPNFDAGSMVAVKADAAQIQKEAEGLPAITVANLNSGKQVVLAGPKQAVLEAHDLLKEKGYSVVLLPVSAAFHTPLVGHAQQPFAKAIQTVAIHSPHIPVYSNTTGHLYPPESATIRSILEDHILNPVLFKTQIETTHEAGGRVFIEFGPKNVLANLVSSILSEQPHATVALNANPKKGSYRQLQDAVVQLRVLGLDLKL